MQPYGVLKLRPDVERYGEVLYWGGYVLLRLFCPINGEHKKPMPNIDAIVALGVQKKQTEAWPPSQEADDRPFAWLDLADLLEDYGAKQAGASSWTWEKRQTDVTQDKIVLASLEMCSKKIIRPNTTPLLILSETK